MLQLGRPAADGACLPRSHLANLLLPSLFLPLITETIVVKIPTDFSLPESCTDLVEEVRLRLREQGAACSRLRAFQRAPLLPAATALPPPADLSSCSSNRCICLQLARLVYAHGNDNQKGSAMLCTVYFRCIRDDFYGGRDALLMSRIQDQTQQLDARMQARSSGGLACLHASAAGGWNGWMPCARG